MSLKLEVEPESIEVNGNATTNQGNMTSYHWSVVILSLPYTVHKTQTRLYLYVMHNKSWSSFNIIDYIICRQTSMC